MLLFSNPGEIDPRLITTMGVNVKEGDSPIGFFGTGLKYSIAGLLRANASITIDSGLRRFTFSAEQEEIRGKSFGFVIMSEHKAGCFVEKTRLGFTTDLGKTWAPWMLYRELASNAKDENGQTSVVAKIGPPRSGQTQIWATGLDEAHAERAKIFLESKPMIALRGLELRPAAIAPGKLFYRGVRVLDLQSPSIFCYNVLNEQRLTEDRTLAALWNVQWDIANAILSLEDRAIIRAILLAPSSTLEGHLDFERPYIEAPIFDEVLEGLMRTDLARINPTAVRRIEAKRGRQPPETTRMTKIETMQLESAQTFLREVLDCEISVPIWVCESLGDGIFGLARKGEIYLARATFNKGTKQVAVTLLEEWLHAEKSLSDFDRPFQDWVLEKCIALGEALQGRPI